MQTGENMLAAYCSKGDESTVLTHNIDGACWTSYAFRIVLDHICGLEDTLDRASFDVELIIAKAITAI